VYRVHNSAVVVVNIKH